jgi:hypothetical protein
MSSTGSSPFVAGNASERRFGVVTTIRNGDERVSISVLARAATEELPPFSVPRPSPSPDDQEEITMTKLSLLGIAAVAAYATLAGPSFAQQRSTHVANAYAQATACADHEAGNPYNKDTDYMGWSAWRVRGSWDASNDYTCTPSHVNHGRF